MSLGCCREQNPRRLKEGCLIRQSLIIRYQHHRPIPCHIQISTEEKICREQRKEVSLQSSQDRNIKIANIGQHVHVPGMVLGLHSHDPTQSSLRKADLREVKAAVHDTHLLSDRAKVHLALESVLMIIKYASR